jgi:hypothetical protein
LRAQIVLQRIPNFTARFRDVEEHYADKDNNKNKDTGETIGGLVHAFTEEQVKWDTHKSTVAEFAAIAKDRVHALDEDLDFLNEVKKRLHVIRTMVSAHVIHTRQLTNVEIRRGILLRIGTRRQ